jgi:hypothetical protein
LVLTNLKDLMPEIGRQLGSEKPNVAISHLIIYTLLLNVARCVHCNHII